MLFYRIFVWLYPKAVKLLAFKNEKAKAWIQGRRQLFPELAAVFHRNTAPVIWMHCSSLGEFEQGLPVLEALKEKYPSRLLLVTFFSPSGYEVRKKHPSADHVFYLPMDSPANATRFLNIVQPSLVIFVKYEYWYYYLREVYERKIPLLLISGIFREDQPFFRWYGRLYRKMLRFFTGLLVQTEESAALVTKLGISQNLIVAGDTRFDRVIEIAGNFSEIAPVNAFCAGHPVVVAGSTWTDDDEELDHFANTHPTIRFIIAPHDIGDDRLQECLLLYKHSMLYSDYLKIAEDDKPGHINTLIIDNIGMLSRLYYYASVCYIGGGFGDDGIHNVLEAAVYSKPVIFGPVYDKYIEGVELLDAGGAFSIEDALELEAELNRLLVDREHHANAAAAAGAYVKIKAGATAAVLKFIQENRLLIN